MKKVLLAVFSIIIAVTVFGCDRGESDYARVKSIKSDIYTKADIEQALYVVKNKFDKDMAGCTLKEIHYAGDSETRKAKDWAKRKHADQVIVITSSFDVDSEGGDGSFEPNTTYDNWPWILVRNKGGKWKIVDQGY